MISILIRFILATLGVFMILIGGVFSLIGLFIFALMVCWFLISFLRHEKYIKEIGYMSFLKSDFMLTYGWVMRLPLAYVGGTYLLDGGAKTMFGIFLLFFVFGYNYLDYKWRMEKLER